MSTVFAQFLQRNVEKYAGTTLFPVVFFAVEITVDGAGGRGVHAGRFLQHFLRRLADGAYGCKVLHQRFGARFADARNGRERGGDGRLFALLAVVADGKAVHLVLNARHQREHARVD